MTSGAADGLEQDIQSAYRAATAAEFPPEQRAWLAQLMTIWASAWLEHTFRAILVETCRRSAGPAATRYVENQLAQVRNPGVARMCAVLAQFDTRWKEAFRGEANEGLRTSVDSIVNHRNRIAHGERSRITVEEVHAHFRVLRSLGPVLAAVLADTAAPGRSARPRRVQPPARGARS